MKLTQQYGEAGHAMPFQGIVGHYLPLPDSVLSGQCHNKCNIVWLTKKSFK